MLSPTQPCPCGSQKTYNDCCLIIHNNHASASTAEQLMRARYSAFVVANIDFLIKSHLDIVDSAQERAQIKASTTIAWCKLEIINTSKQDTNDISFVEFKAWYIENETLQPLHENSRFIRKAINNHRCWFYVDGTFPAAPENKQTIARNAPCPCNSGKKFKRCCAN